jgi:hypothetical protein
MKLELVEHWPTVLWRSATTRTAALTGLIVGVVGTHYLVLLGILPFLPPYLQLPLALLIGGFVVGPTVASRLFKQPKMQAKIAEKTDASV